MKIEAKDFISLEIESGKITILARDRNVFCGKHRIEIEITGDVRVTSGITELH